VKTVQTPPQIETRVPFNNNFLSNPKFEDPQDRFDADGEGQPLAVVGGQVQLPDSVRQFLTAAIADSTRKAYRSDLADFYLWGGVVPSPPEQLAQYLSFRAQTLSPVTLTRRAVAISRAHTSRGLSDPSKTDLVRTVLRGIRRKNGQPQRQVQPLLKADLLAITDSLTSTTKGLRDRALLLIGFSAALRRSELVALDYTDIQFVNEGLVLTIRRSKTDQEGAGRRIGVPWGRTSACAVKALKAWLEHVHIESGPIFTSVNKAGAVGSRLSDHAVANIVKTHAQAVGLNADQFSGHSLRSGLVTSAAQAGISVNKIMAQTGHRSIEMVQRYVRAADIFINNAGGIL
jgi:integrase